jgi:hypothetical protein
MGTQLTIENVLLYPDSTRTLLSYRYIRKNELHVITNEENNEEFLHIIKKNRDGYDILERIHFLSSIVLYIHKTRSTCCIQSNLLECRCIHYLAWMPWASRGRNDEKDYW